MEKKLLLIEEAIKLENNIAELYRKYSVFYKKDQSFWKKMASEEVEHSSLLKGIKEIYLGGENFPDEMLYDNIEEMENLNQMIKDYIIKIQNENIIMLEDYEFAYKIENSAYELHYDEQMKIKSTDLMEMFKKLNNYDKDHAKRINLLLLRGI